MKSIRRQAWAVWSLMAMGLVAGLACAQPATVTMPGTSAAPAADTAEARPASLVRSPAPAHVTMPNAAGLSRVTSVEGITEYRLPNGLQVLLIPDDSKPTTTVNMTYRVGSRFESYGETGMAHLLEHLLFKGSPRPGPNSTSVACAPTAAPGTTAPTTSPALPPTTTTCGGIWPGRPMRWCTASLPSAISTAR